MIELTEDILDPEKITALVRQDSNGSVITFLGTTRNNFDGKTVLTLEYEAFDEMAVKKLEEVRQELIAEFGLEEVAISHRIGTVDRIKEVVPIWKKEIYQDGSRWVACEDHEFDPNQTSAESHTH